MGPDPFEPEVDDNGPETPRPERPARRLSLGPKVRAMMMQEDLVATRGTPVSKEWSMAKAKGQVLNALDLKKYLKENRARAFLSRVKSNRLKREEVMDSDSHHIPITFADTERMDMKRRMLMLLTRKAGPLTIFFDVTHLRYTIVPPILGSYNFIVIAAAYTATCVTTRMGMWDVPDPDGDAAPVSDDATALLGMELLVTFTLVFYFGYCYNRFWEQYSLAMACKAAIIDAVMLARASRLPHTELVDLYRYLNLAQAAGYVALSQVYTRANLFDSFARLHNLLPSSDLDKEVKRINQVQPHAFRPTCADHTAPPCLLASLRACVRARPFLHVFHRARVNGMRPQALRGGTLTLSCPPLTAQAGGRPWRSGVQRILPLLC